MSYISSENMGSFLGYLQREKVGDNSTAKGTQPMLTRRLRFCRRATSSSISLSYFIFHLMRLFDRCGPDGLRTSGSLETSLEIPVWQFEGVETAAK